jgi:intracellular sulfur oxidation DsrE/DsrF family protein
MNKYRVLFHLDQGMSSKYKLVLANIENLFADLGEEIEVELVTNAEGIGLLYKKPNIFSEIITGLAAKGVRFTACANSLRQQNLTSDFLLDFTEIVPSGVGEIVRRQAEGWVYIKP